MKAKSLRNLCIWMGMAVVASAQHAAVAPMNGAESLEKLKLGNQHYLAGQFDLSRIGASARSAVVSGQHPFATVLTCADSRVPPEVIFDQGLGDLFVVRVAGAVPDQAVLGSIEYAAEHLHVPLVVVMGHTSCGAVKSAMDSKAPVKRDPAGANLERILSAIRPSLVHARHGRDPWENAVYASVAQNITDALRLSPVIEQMATKGVVMVVGAVYDLNSGRVDFLKPAGVHIVKK